MRPRICMSIASSNGDAIIYRESKERVEASKRRAQFEKNRVKLRCVIVGCKPINKSLISFNNNVANAIANFKSSRKCH